MQFMEMGTWLMKISVPVRIAPLMGWYEASLGRVWECHVVQLKWLSRQAVGPELEAKR